MTKAIKIILGILLISAILGTGYYLVSPLFRNNTLNEPSPLDLKMNKAALSHMNQTDQNQFMAEFDSMKSKSSQTYSTEPTGGSIIAQGTFQNYFHEVKGEASIIQNNNQLTLRLENFETLNGPNLHIYLSKNLEATDYVDLGAMKATMGNINYDVPSNTDTSLYNKVLVWCVPFKVLFGYAKLPIK